MHVLRAKEKKIKGVLNIVIRVLEESIHILDGSKTLNMLIQVLKESIRILNIF